MTPAQNLFLLWLVLFGFYGIMFLEAFGLTKHNTQENRFVLPPQGAQQTLLLTPSRSISYISFRDFATSLVMLAVFTNGEVGSLLPASTAVNSALTLNVACRACQGWNGYMHDYALSWPRCTKDDNLYLRSDCGSVPAAYALFASWNILSMYLFVNLVRHPSLVYRPQRPRR